MQMAKISTSIIMTIALVVLLTISSVPTLAAKATRTRTCRGAGEFCGGIAGFICCDGFKCKLSGDFPDAGGVCVPASTDCPGVGEFCGGIAGFICCKGLKCQLEGDFPDAGGVCVANSLPTASL